MKKLFISVYQENENNLFVENGFSFIDNINFNNSDILFIKTYNYDLNEINNLIKNYKDIYISLILLQEFYEILPIILLNPNKHFYLGGTFYYGFEKFIENEILPKIKNITIIKGLAEKYFDNKNISINYNFYAEKYFKNRLNGKNIWLNYNLNKNCYWNKCIFCLETCYWNEYHRNIESAIEVIKEDIKIFGNKLRFKIYSPELNNSELKKLFELNTFFKNQGVKIDLNIRPEAIKIIKKYNDLSSFIFKIGIESFNERIINFFNKNFDINESIEILYEILKRKGEIYASFIRGIPLMEEEINKDFNEFKKLKIFTKQNSKRLVIGISPHLEIYNCLEEKILNQLKKYFKDDEYIIDYEYFFTLKDYILEILKEFSIELPTRKIVKPSRKNIILFENKLIKMFDTVYNVNKRFGRFI